jgi:Fe-S cluster biogenesis protein NfuA
MFIQTEETPNPNTIKFMPGRSVFLEDFKGYPTSFSKTDDLSVSPLAESLLLIPHIEAVFLGHDFISITKDEAADWYLLKPHLLGTIMEHFINEIPTIKTGQHQVKDQNFDDLDDVSKKIMDIIDTRVRPAVAQDGGDILFHSFKEGVVYLEMKGACSGCPSSTQTLKAGIESMLKFYVPEVQDVQQITD